MMQTFRDKVMEVMESEAQDWWEKKDPNGIVLEMTEEEGAEFYGATVDRIFAVLFGVHAAAVSGAARATDDEIEAAIVGFGD